MAEKSSGKRHDLTLKEKYEVIKVVRKQPKIGSRNLAKMFKCGKTQICTILKNTDQIEELYESNVSSKGCQFRKRNRKSEFSDINEALYNRYQLYSSIKKYIS